VVERPTSQPPAPANPNPVPFRQVGRAELSRVGRWQRQSITHHGEGGHFPAKFPPGGSRAGGTPTHNECAHHVRQIPTSGAKTGVGAARCHDRWAAAGLPPMRALGSAHGLPSRLQLASDRLTTLQHGGHSSSTTDGVGMKHARHNSGRRFWDPAAPLTRVVSKQLLPGL
jgi:hypothetical protein